MEANTKNSFERGPANWTPMTDEDRIEEGDVLTFNTDILRNIIPRLWKPAPLADIVLALEVIDGPFKGVIYSYQSFVVYDAQRTDPQRAENGLVPVRFETKIWKKPDGFRENDAFDEFTRTVLMSWLAYLAQHDLKTTISAVPLPGIH